MRIREFFARGGPVFSFEFFPPKTDDGERKLLETVRSLKELGPSFVSVTKTGAKPAEVQAKLAERGITVSMPMIYTVRSKMRARRTARKIGQRRAAINGSAAPTDIKTLARFIRAVQDLGGIVAARNILKEMEE